jgi:alkylated DNA repair protein (DNA oxidative demethylase)
MSAAMTNAGALGRVSGASGYRYSSTDPESGRPWPPMPELFATIARRAAAESGYCDFVPDACLVNRYQPGARMGLHQDRDEAELSAPIVSVSLGLPVVFLWGGATRTDRPVKVRLEHGDVVVFGGPSRLFFHGVAPLDEGEHPLTGATRLNLTLRKAGVSRRPTQAEREPFPSPR